MMDYAHLPPGAVVLALWQHTRPLGLGCLLPPPVTPSAAEVDRHLSLLGREAGVVWLDYLWGRPLKIGVDLRGHRLLRTDLYDRDAGPGTARRVLDGLLASAAVGEESGGDT